MDAQERELMSDQDGQNAGAKSAQSQAAKAMTMDKIMKKKKGVVKSVQIQIDGEVATELTELQLLHSTAEAYDRKHNEDDTAPAIMDEIEALMGRAKETEVVFTFESIGSVAYDDIVGDPENQPTDEQKKEGATFNSLTFPPALIAAASVDPVITLEQATAIFQDRSWNGAELEKLFYAALEVNTETGDIPLSKGVSSGMDSSLLNFLTALNTESPTQSS